MPTYILEIALASPLRQTFDYLPPARQDCSRLEPGTRLEVPFGRRTVIGLLLAIKHQSEVDDAALKAAHRVIDTQPAIDSSLIELCRWSASYYMHPIGEALFAALPPALRKGKAMLQQQAKAWRLTGKGLGLSPDSMSRAPRQRQAVQYLLQQGELHEAEMSASGISKNALLALGKQELVETFNTTVQHHAIDLRGEAGPPHNEEQVRAVAAILAGLDSFQPFLLQGITGSGKTEVYLGAIEEVLQRGGQALVMVPEIGLTPQTLSRFEQRFPGGVVAIHSGMGEGQRLQAWRAAREGRARVVVGTRSAVFTPMPALGLIVIDEEHDTSYKQQDGFRFSARDVAVKRAQLADIPIVLGSATPSAESLHNAEQARYQTLPLRQRAGAAKAPTYELLDLRGQPLEEGFSPRLLDAIAQEIKAGHQVLVFLNRRGFAPTLLCHSCGWVASCSHCDARLVVHRASRALKCHHCEYQTGLPNACPQCHSPQLTGVGQGTERSEEFLKTRFAGSPILRIDRDTTRRKDAMDQFTARIQGGEPAILVGTQMLAKGHHFPAVTLVAVLDADAGLLSNDFRGPERTAQTLMQVAGRAGRAQHPGTVLIQTHQPENPLLQRLIMDDYGALMSQVLAERAPLELPPFGYLAVIRSESSDQGAAEQLLIDLRKYLDGKPSDLSIIGPLPPPMARRAGRYRFHLLFKATHRGSLHRQLGTALGWLENRDKSRRLRWSLDVDPQDFI